MEDLNETTVTEAVLQQMADTPDPRLREIMAAAVKHLHAFAREVSLKPEEWLYGIKFLTEVGQACTPYRQEFILLSDTLGLSRMVNILHDGRAETVGTETSLLGPFYRTEAPLLALGDSIAQASPAGRGDRPVRHRPRRGRRTPVRQRHSSRSGRLTRTAPTTCRRSTPPTMDWRAQFRTDDAGPLPVPRHSAAGLHHPARRPGRRHDHRRSSRHGCRPAHTHFLIGAPGFRELVTAIYYGYDQYIDTDTGVRRLAVADRRNRRRTGRGLAVPRSAKPSPTISPWPGPSPATRTAGSVPTRPASWSQRNE